MVHPFVDSSAWQSHRLNKHHQAVLALLDAATLPLTSALV